MPTFRVLAYNILYGGVGREKRVRDVVSAIAPDVAVFTEVMSADSLDVIADAVGPHRAAAAIPRNGHGAVIVSRWPIVQSRLYGPPWARQKFVEATIEPFGGPPFTVCGVHLVPQPLWPFEICRRVEIGTLVEQLGSLDGAPHIIAGDFNSVRSGDAFRQDHAAVWVRAQCAVQGGWPRWALKRLVNAAYVDCYRACHPHEDGFTVPSWGPVVRIDYVFASPSLTGALRAAGTWEARESADAAPEQPSRSLLELMGWSPVRSLGDFASDHLPVWVDFEWPSG
ncbi:MAG TPA: endonuclease/exonuclease/phosphatase family protein [Vicinamibacterales bacterium]|nr:endonuclease/exonuclease/phosphatase family protein [Vicinamibacterales bacterium]